MAKKDGVSGKETAEQSDEASLEALYLLARSLGPGHPAWRQVIGVIGREGRRWWRRSEGASIVEADPGNGLRLLVDLQDRYGFDLAHGLITEATDFALFSHMARQAAEIWDVGSNVGLYALAAGRGLKDREGRAFAFEPNPPIFDLLKRSIEANGLAARISSFCLALSDKREQRTFHACRDSAFSGLVRTERSSEAAVLDLETRCLDDLWLEQGGRPIDLLKIDVEGGEQAVLAGGQEALAASPDLVMQIEVSQKNHQDVAPAWLIALHENAFDVVAYDDSLCETVIDGAELSRPRDGNLFLCRRNGGALSRLRHAATAEQEVRAKAPPTPDIFASVEVLLTLLERNRAERNALSVTKGQVEQRCQELADKLQGRNLVIAKLKSQLEAKVDNAA